MARPANKLMGKAIHAVSVIGLLLVVWQVCMLVFDPPSYLVPSPKEVFSRFLEQPSYLFLNAWITIKEMLIGFLVGSIAGILIALLLSQFRFLDKYLMPIVVVSQTLPVFAIAPLLVVWFGLGLGSKIVMASLIIFFPVASIFYDGLKSTPTVWMDLGKSWGASRWQILRYVKIPAAMPALKSGLIVAATIAPIGAIVGEWAGAAGGLGFVTVQANARSQIDVVFAALVLLAISAWVLRWTVIQICDRLIWWSEKQLG